MDNAVIEKFIKYAGDIADGLTKYEQMVNSVFIQDFMDKVRYTKDYANDVINTNRDLKIGIVGQVKAGKSSFLNALIFDGNDILPKAATPMTAALTKISYAEKQSAKVVFYSREDWRFIEKLAVKYDKSYEDLLADWKKRKQLTAARNSHSLSGLMDKFIGKRNNACSYFPDLEPSDTEIQKIKQKIRPQYRACKELVELTKKNEMILDKLDKEEDISIENLIQDMEQYVGASGIYTPIVKYIELSINNELIKGVQIVDTPGLGDPIISRSQKTKEFLMACDAVFLLSPSPQFMKRDDLELIMNILPEDGIKRAVLVGSQFDLAMLDDPAREKQDVGKVLRRTCSKLNESAMNALREGRKAEKGYVKGQVLSYLEQEADRQIRDDGKLYYIASLIYNVARHIERNESLNDEEQHIIDELVKRFDGMSNAPEFLREFANIDRLRDREFAKMRKEKELIISERSRSFAQEQLQVLQKMLEDIQIECEQNLHFIQTEDLDVLQKKMTASQEAIYSMRRDIRNAFEVCAAETKNYMVNVAAAIKAQAEGHTDINVSEESRKIERSSTSGHLFWKKTTYRTDTEYYKAAEVKDVISNINKYIRESDAYLAKELNKAIEIDAVRNKIKGIVLRSLEKADANYDESDVIGPVEILLKSLMVPEFSTVDSKQYNKMIMDQFKESIVTGEKIADLRLKQEMILEDISKDFSEKIEKKTNEITRLLNDKAVNFTDQVKKEIEGKIKILNDGLQNKQESIQKYNKFLKYINNAKQELREFSFD